MAAIDDIILAPESFQTIYLRREDRVIMRTERGAKIIIKRIIPDEWKPWRIYDQELVENNNKKEIFLVDKAFVGQITSSFLNSISSE